MHIATRQWACIFLVSVQKKILTVGLNRQSVYSPCKLQDTMCYARSFQLGALGNP